MTTLSRTEMIKHLERALEEFSNFDYWNEYLESAEHEIEQVLDALKAEELRAGFDGIGPFELTAVGHKFTDEDFKAPRPFAKRIVYLVPGQELKVTFDASPAASSTETK